MKIHLHAHPFAGTPPQTFEASSLGEWLLERYGAVPRVNVQVFRGEPSAETEITGDVPAILENDASAYTVLQSPGMEPATWALMSKIMTVISAVSFVAALLAPKPAMPANVNRTQASPNNALAERSNQLRMLQRVEDIYGTVKSIPSLMMQTYEKYLLNQKYEYGYYCISRGYCDVAELRDGDTLLADITGAAAAVYEPFTSPNSGSALIQIGDPIIDDILSVARVAAIDGLTLKALNQLQLPTPRGFDFTPHADGGTITQTSDMTAFDTTGVLGTLSAGQTITVTMTDTAGTISPATATVSASANKFTFAGAEAFLPGVSVTVTGFLNGGNNGTFTVATSTTGELTVTAGALVDEVGTADTSFSTTVNYSGNYEVLSIALPYTIKLTPASSADWTVPIAKTCSVQIDDVTEYTDWITLRDIERTEIWCNIVATGGLFLDAGSGPGVASVDYAIEIEQLDADLVPLGVVETVTGTLTGATQSVVADTVEHVTGWTGPARVRARRTSSYPFGFGGTVMDEIKWTDLYSIASVALEHFGNKTTVQTVTKATPRATAVKTRQLNCLASRKLPIYDAATGTFSGAFEASGRLASGTIAATSKLVDIIAAVSADPLIGARDVATEIDMAQIAGVQAQLDAWNTACGQFNYTLDTDNLSFEETVIMVANAGFCIAYRQNGRIRLAFDYAQAQSAALFTHRNKKPRSETVTRKFASDAEYDGIEFVYMDPDSNQQESIVLPSDFSYTRLKKYEIAGIRSFEQAWLRANREYYKLVGQRQSIETVVTLDARSLLPNARIDIVDNTRFKAFDGEVVGQSGLTLTLSQAVRFTPGVPHSIVLMRRDGSLQSIAATAGASANQVVLAGAPSEAIVTTPGAEGIRTIYSFAADGDRGKMAYLVTEIDLAADPQYATVRAINYSDSYYQKDHAAIPDKRTVITDEDFFLITEAGDHLVTEDGFSIMQG